MSLSVIALGGGVQSTAMVVAAVHGLIDARTALFCNVGDDSEHPATLVYVRTVLKPWADARGVTVHELIKTKRDGTVETVYGRATDEALRSDVIPVRMSQTGKPAGRSCTADFKTRLIGKWLRSRGASADEPWTVDIGISVDEIERAGRGRDEPYERRAYPLLDLGWRRSDCAAYIAKCGLPVPPKSACWFCPFHRRSTWAEMRRDQPDLFARAVAMEQQINAKRARQGKDPVWFTDAMRPLDEAIASAQDALFDADDFHSIGESGCDEGVCFV